MTGMEICGQITEGPGPGLEGQALDLAPPADTSSVFFQANLIFLPQKLTDLQYH